jgi:hypothetical protein
MPGGRPSKFKPEHVEQAAKLAKLGATDREIADFFEVSEATIYRWKNDQPEFCEALKVGKEAADARVEQSLYRRALGYSHDAVKISTVEGQIVQTPYVEHYPPDTTAAIFWLKNRRSDEWRDVSRTEHTGKNGEAIRTEQVSSDADVVARAIAGLVARARAGSVVEQPDTGSAGASSL